MTKTFFKGKGRIAFMGTNGSLVTQQAEKCVQVLSKYQVCNSWWTTYRKLSELAAIYVEIIYFEFPEVLTFLYLRCILPVYPHNVAGI